MSDLTKFEVHARATLEISRMVLQLADRYGLDRGSMIHAVNALDRELEGDLDSKTPRAEERERIAQWLLERSTPRDPADPTAEKSLLMQELAKGIQNGDHWTALEAVEEGVL